MSTTPETDNEADDTHNLCLYYDCQGKDENIPVPIVVPVEFARKLEIQRDETRTMLQGIISAAIQTVGGASMMHPKLTRCILAGEKLLGTIQNQSNQP